MLFNEFILLPSVYFTPGAVGATLTLLWQQCRSKGAQWLAECIVIPAQTKHFQVSHHCDINTDAELAIPSMPEMSCQPEGQHATCCTQCKLH